VDVAGLEALQTPAGQRLLAALPAYDEARAITLAARLRRDHPAALVAAALTQARLRARARARFGELANRMFFTPDGLEQATRPVVARRRAQRYAAAGAARIADLCCGIGADLLALAATGAEVTGVDRDPLTVAVARANAAAAGLADRARLACADVTTFDLTGHDAAFVDPSRRTARGRVFDPGAYSPPLAFVIALAAQVPATGAKVAPGLPHELVPANAEAEWVSDRGEVTEAALWFGPLASGAHRRATVLPAGATLAAEPGTAAPAVGPLRRWLYEPDGAVIRAGLISELAARLGGTLIDPTIAYLTADAQLATPFATAYEVLDAMPFQLKRLRATLRAKGVGRVVVKKRGSAIQPEQLRRQLRLDPAAPGEAVVVLTRLGGARVVIIATPVPRPSPP
jgi:SAM-dependent methyltransferase